MKTFGYKKLKVGCLLDFGLNICTVFLKKCDFTFTFSSDRFGIGWDGLGQQTGIPFGLDSVGKLVGLGLGSENRPMDKSVTEPCATIDIRPT